VGRHSAEYVYGEGEPNGPRKKNSLVDTTLTTLKKIMHLDSREDSEREPRIKEDLSDRTTERIPVLDYEPLPDYGNRGDVYQNWDYLITGTNGKQYSGWYGITPTPVEMADHVASSILDDWFSYNEIPYERRRFYEIAVRRPGAAKWQGFAEGRE